MKAPISFRKDPQGPGAFLHDAFGKPLGYAHTVAIAETIVAAVNVLNYATLDDVLSNPKRHDNEVFGIRLGDLRKLRAAIAAATGEAP